MSSLSVQGSLTFQTITDRRQDLLKALRLGKDFVLGFDAMEKLDVCGLQLLLAARKEARSRGLSMGIRAGKDLDRINKLAVTLGFEPFGEEDR